MKLCRRCKESKPYTKFNKRADSPDGHTTACKSCISEQRKGRSHGVTGTQTMVPEGKRKEVFLSAILRMQEAGIASDRTAREMATRVGDM